MTDSPLAAVLYGRQSQNKDRSIEEQLDLGRKRAATESWRVEGIYHDGVSASRHTTRQRDDWPKVVAKINAGKADVLWLWESSRGDRKLSAWAALLELCRDRRVGIYVETHRRLYDMDRYRDWKTLAEDGVDSEAETAKDSERVTRAMTTDALAGKVHGQIPYGYRREYRFTQAGKREVVGQFPDEAEARIVRFIFRAIAQGHSLLSIAEHLNRRGVTGRMGAAWSGNQVRGVALNRAYIGQRIHDPEGRAAGRRRPGPSTSWYEAEWPPLVERELFWAVYRTLTDPARVTTRAGKAKHLLSMIARCGECGQVLTVSYRRRGGPHYGCRRSCVLIGQAALDEHVTIEVLTYLSRPRVWKRLVAAGPTDNAELMEARGELADLEQHYAELKELARLGPKRGGMSGGAFAGIEPGILADLEAARAKVGDLEAPPPLRFLLNGPGDLKTRWEDAPVAARRDAIRKLATVTVDRSAQRGPVRVPAAQRTTIDWITEQVAPS